MTQKTLTKPRSAQGNQAVTDRLGLAGPEGARRRGALLRRLLATGDWIALMAALCLTTVATSTTDVSTLFWAILFSPVLLLVLKLHGLYDNDHRRIRHSTFDELSSLVSACVLGTLALDGLLALSPVGPLSPLSAILVGAATLCGCLAMRAILRFWWHLLTGFATGIVIGPRSAAEVIARRVATHPEARLALIGYLIPAEESDEPGKGTLPCLGSSAEIARIAREYDVERVVVTEQEMSEEGVERLIEECKSAGLGLTFLPRHHGLLGPGIELNRLAELPVLDFRFSDPPRSTMTLKRTMDVLVSGTMLTLLSPVLLGVSLLILVDTGLPVFFRQRRAGKDGEPFTMLKFRTMVADAEERLGEFVDLKKLDEPAFKIPDDPRVTRVGRLLRRASLDELPQLLNVLKGEMSLVGPRPEEEAVVALYDERQRARLAIKPGLTGPMQVYGRGDLTFEERLALERDYLDNLSVAGDLAILLRTPGAIFRGDGAY
ncbi:MAG TPA: sugar transferase [Solirubrobacterales bacterium]|nr:sugar transferase [Solirubrobacterales bacterium]